MQARTPRQIRILGFREDPSPIRPRHDPSLTTISRRVASDVTLVVNTSPDWIVAIPAIPLLANPIPVLEDRRLHDGIDLLPRIAEVHHLTCPKVHPLGAPPSQDRHVRRLEAFVLSDLHFPSVGLRFRRQLEVEGHESPPYMSYYIYRHNRTFCVARQERGPDEIEDLLRGGGGASRDEGVSRVRASAALASILPLAGRSAPVANEELNFLQKVRPGEAGLDPTSLPTAF